MLFNDTTSEIYYINQGTDPSALLTGMLFKATNGENVLPVGDYTVRIGNDAGAAVDVDLKVVVENNNVTLKFGDVDGNGVVDGTDAGYIASFFTGAGANVGGDYAIGAEYEVPAK